MKGYEVQRIGGESLLVVIEYVETTKQLETGELETCGFRPLFMLNKR
jgi:hypothetical protein